MAMSKEEIAAKAQAAGLALSPEQLEMAHQAVLMKEAKDARAPQAAPVSPLRAFLNSAGEKVVHGFNRVVPNAQSGGSIAGGMVGGALSGGSPLGIGAGAAAGNLGGQILDRIPKEWEAFGRASASHQPYVFGANSGPLPSVGDAAIDGAMQATVAKVLPGIGSMGRERAAALVNPLAGEIAKRSGPAAAAAYAKGELPRQLSSELSPEAFAKFHEAAAVPNGRIVGAPLGATAEKGSRLATPQLTQRASAGSELLKRFTAEADARAAAGAAGDIGGKLAAQSEAEMAGPLTDRLLAARPQVQDAARAALRPRTLPGKPGSIDVIETPGSPARIDPYKGQKPDAQFQPGGDVALPDQMANITPAKPPTVDRVITPAVPPRQVPRGEAMVNKAQMEPNAFNDLREATPSAADFWRKLAEEKSAGMEMGVRADLKGAGMRDAAKADAMGVSGADVPGLTSDASVFQGMSNALKRQRGGYSLEGPSRNGFWANALDKTGKLLNRPQSDLAGFRPESLEAAAGSNQARLAEIEAARRGLPAVNATARAEALNGLPRAGITNMTGPKQILGAMESPALDVATYDILRKAFSDPEGP